MDPLLFAMFAVGNAVLLIWGTALARRYGWRTSGIVLLSVVAALVYENAVLAAGRFIGEGPLLEGLNAARYWMHAFLTPLLVFFAWDTMARAGLGVVRRGWARFLAPALYAALVILELVTEVRGLSLEPTWKYGMLSYASVEPAAGPSPMVMAVIAVLLLASIVVWWNLRWPWFFAGIALMAAVAVIDLPIPSASVTNACELVLLASLLATMRHQDGLTGSAGRAPEPTRLAVELSG